MQLVGTLRKHKKEGIEGGKVELGNIISDLKNMSPWPVGYRLPRQEAEEIEKFLSKSPEDYRRLLKWLGDNGIPVGTLPFVLPSKCSPDCLPPQVVQIIINAPLTGTKVSDELMNTFFTHQNRGCPACGLTVGRIRKGLV